MFDLLLGSPGESRDSIIHTIELMKRSNPDRVGIALGVRVYEGTELAAMVKDRSWKEGLIGKEGEIESKFFMEPEIAPFVSELLDDLTWNDERFFFFNPINPKLNYNDNANQRLVDAIREGYRGAYWDILRRIEE